MSENPTATARAQASAQDAPTTKAGDEPQGYTPGFDYGQVEAADQTDDQKAAAKIAAKEDEKRAENPNAVVYRKAGDVGGDSFTYGEKPEDDSPTYR